MLVMAGPWSSSEQAFRLAMYITGTVQILLGVGLVGKKRYSFVLFYMCAVLCSVEAVTMSVNPEAYALLIAWWIIPGIFYYPKRWRDFGFGRPRIKMAPAELADAAVLLAHGEGRDQKNGAETIRLAVEEGISREIFVFEVFCLRIFAMNLAAAQAMAGTEWFQEFCSELNTRLASIGDEQGYALIQARCAAYHEAFKKAKPDCDALEIGMELSKACTGTSMNDFCVKFGSMEYMVSLRFMDLCDMAGWKRQPEKSMERSNAE